jgi:uncharacterized protein with NRDE domain
MCLIVCAWQASAAFPLVVAANRDEFYQRPTAPLAVWDGPSGIAAGRDLQAGGTWLGYTRDGRFAAVTNYRSGGGHDVRPKSRGWLVTGFLEGHDRPQTYGAEVARDAASYGPFNLLLADPSELVYVAGATGEQRRLPPGVYGLSNHLLDTPWPKLEKATRSIAGALEKLSAPEDLLAPLLDRDQAPEPQLPETGVSLEWERMLSSIFVQSPTYGTRSSTVLTRDAHGAAAMLEVRFGPEGETGRTKLRFEALGKV